MLTRLYVKLLILSVFGITTFLIVRWLLLSWFSNVSYPSGYGGIALPFSLLNDFIRSGISTCNFAIPVIRSLFVRCGLSIVSESASIVPNGLYSMVALSAQCFDVGYMTIRDDVFG